MSLNLNQTKVRKSIVWLHRVPSQPKALVTFLSDLPKALFEELTSEFEFISEFEFLFEFKSTKGLIRGADK